MILWHFQTDNPLIPGDPQKIVPTLLVVNLKRMNQILSYFLWCMTIQCVMCPPNLAGVCQLVRILQLFKDMSPALNSSDGCTLNNARDPKKSLFGEKKLYLLGYYSQQKYSGNILVSLPNAKFVRLCWLICFLLFFFLSLIETHTDYITISKASVPFLMLTG